jgi:hypothetical protein
VQSTDTAIVEARGLKPQLHFPCRIAVYVRPSNTGDWRWTPDDRAALEQWAAVLKQEGIASEVFLLPEMLTGKGDVKELRLAGAQCGADAVFIIQGTAQTDTYKNPGAVFNLTVVGGYLVPASHKDSLFVMEGILIDVDNGFIYAGLQVEGMGKVMRPTFVIEDKDSIAKAKANAVAQFSLEVVKRMRQLAGDRTGRLILPSNVAAPVGGMAGPMSKIDLRQGEPTHPAELPRITAPNALVNPASYDPSVYRLPGPIPPGPLPPGPVPPGPTSPDAAPGCGVRMIRTAGMGGLMTNILAPSIAP